MEEDRAHFSIRPMVPDDVAEVARLDRQVSPSPWSEEQFRNELNNPRAHVDLLVVEQRIAAYICCWTIAGELEIQNVATAPSFRRRGLAEKLLQYVIARALNGQIEKVILEVRRGNAAARSLYEKLGFKGSGVRANYYSDNEDALLMECDLSKFEKY